MIYAFSGLLVVPYDFGLFKSFCRKGKIFNGRLPRQAAPPTCQNPSMPRPDGFWRKRVVLPLCGFFRKTFLRFTPRHPFPVTVRNFTEPIARLQFEFMRRGQNFRLAYSIQEAADLLGVDYFSVYRLIQRGKLRACRALHGKLLGIAPAAQRLKRARAGWSGCDAETHSLSLREA